MGISPAKRDRLLNYISNIKFEDDPLHDTMHGGDKNDGYAITVNSKLNGHEDLANMVTMLVHEANHCDEAYLRDNPEESDVTDTRHRDNAGNPITAPYINSKQEERACETLGLLTCATLIDKGVISGNYSRYNGHNVTEYLTNPDLLHKDVEEWVQEGYTNYIEDFDGNITIEHMMMPGVNNGERLPGKIEIKKGDVVKIGDKEYTIGSNNIFIEHSDSAPILQLNDYTTQPPRGLVDGRIVFDDVIPTSSELEKVGLSSHKPSEQTVQIVRNGQVIYTGKIYK